MRILFSALLPRRRFYRYANDGVTKTPRTPYMNNKIAQLNAVVRDVIPTHGVVPFELGHVLSGYLQDRRSFNLLQTVFLI